jgi:hypothetical protein
VSWPAGTFTYYPFPVVTSAQSNRTPDILNYSLNTGGFFTVDFGGVDTSFSFALIQGRAPSAAAATAQTTVPPASIAPR